MVNNTITGSCQQHRYTASRQDQSDGSSATCLHQVCTNHSINQSIKDFILQAIMFLNKHYDTVIVKIYPYLGGRHYSDRW